MKFLKGFFKGLAALVGLVVVYFGFIGLAPVLNVDAPRIKPGQVAGDSHPAPAFRRDVSFVVDKSRISAFLYLPADTSRPVPAVVMAHGFGGTKDFILENYAKQFRNAGFAVLTFDYRFFGKSEGEPRQLIWLPFQKADLIGAIKFARGLKEVDPDRVALWGTSLGGAHVFMVAAEDTRIAAVIGQVPLLDPTIHAEDEQESTGQILQMVMHAQRDIIRSLLGLSPHSIPIFGKPGSIAMMSTPDAQQAFQNLARPGYVNRVCARIVLRGGDYRPVNVAHKLKVPVLIQLADQDSILPVKAAAGTIKTLGKLAEVKHYNSGHFEVYTGKFFKASARDQVDFLKRHLGKGK